MSAIEIAKQKAKEKKEQEEKKRLLERQHQKWVQKKGDELGQFIENILEQFSEDFTIEKIKDKLWKLHGNKKAYKVPVLYVVLRYDTHLWRGSDESDEQPFNQWVVDIEVPNFKNGRYNSFIGLDTSHDFYCCYLEANFEKQFGEYMSKYY